MSAALLQSIVDGTAPEIVPLTVDQYHRMIADGILPDGAAIELIEGMLVRKEHGTPRERGMVRNSRHAGVVALLQVRLAEALAGKGLHVRSQLPVTLGELHEPEPDLAVIKGSPRQFLANHPRAGDIELIVEVADSSLKFDRSVKDRIYASAGIPQYWIVNLIDGCVEVLTHPEQGRYTHQEGFRPNDTLRIPVTSAEEVQVAVRDLLP